MMRILSPSLCLLAVYATISTRPVVWRPDVVVTVSRDEEGHGPGLHPLGEATNLWRFSQVDDVVRGLEEGVDHSTPRISVTVGDRWELETRAAPNTR